MSISLQRPLRTRQITGSMFGEPAVLVRRTQTRNRFGEASFTETRTNIRVSTNPLSIRDPRTANLREGGIRIEEAREFYTVDKIETNPPDYIEWQGDTYVAHTTADYGDFSESIFERKESQP